MCWVFQCYTRACPALSSGRAVIKEGWKSQWAVSAQTSDSSLEKPLTSTLPPYSPTLSNPKIFKPLPSCCSWLGCKLGLGNFPLQLSVWKEKLSHLLLSLHKMFRAVQKGLNGELWYVFYISSLSWYMSVEHFTKHMFLFFILFNAVWSSVNWSI